MITLLRDPLWQFVGAVIAFVSFWIPIFLYVREKRKKSLGYEIVLITPLLELTDNKVLISLHGKPAKDLQLIVIKLINDGNVPIRSSDFEEPINIHFGKNSKVISAGIQETKPPTLKPKLNIKSEHVIINPTLVNENETILLKVLVSNFSDSINCTARIVGISEVRRLVQNTAKLIYYEVFLLYIGLILVGPAIIGLITKKMTPEASLILIAPGSLFMLAGEITILVELVIRLMHKKSQKLQAAKFITEK